MRKKAVSLFNFVSYNCIISSNMWYRRANDIVSKIFTDSEKVK